MNCEQVKGHLSAYLDDALSFEERQYVATHVAGCLECQHILADFSHFDALLAQLPRVSPGPDLRERFFASQQYLELISTCDGSGSIPESFTHLVPYTLPRSISLPGGQQVRETHPLLLANTALYTPLALSKKNRLFWGQRLFYGIVAAGILLMLGAGGLISWKLWRWQENVPRPSGAKSPTTDQPPKKARSVSTRFLFFRNSTFWSYPGDDRSNIFRLSTENAPVVHNQTVRLALHEQNVSSLFASFPAISQLFHKKRRNFYDYFIETRYSSK